MATEIVKGFLRAIRAGLHWVMHIALLPAVWVLDALGKAITWLSAWLGKVGADVSKIGVDLDGL